MSNDNVIEFINKNCKNQEHSLCHGKWSGLGFNVVCECDCHEIKNKATDEARRPESVAVNRPSSEGLQAI
jgi:hypothetical protein